MPNPRVQATARSMPRLIRNGSAGQKKNRNRSLAAKRRKEDEPIRTPATLEATRPQAQYVFLLCALLI